MYGNSKNAKTLIIGAGPSGLATARCLIDKGIKFVIVDRAGTAGGAFQRIRSRLTLASPVRFLSLPGMKMDAASEYIEAQEYASYLSKYAANSCIGIRRDTVTSIQQRGDDLYVTFSDSLPSLFTSVVVATGMCDHPKWSAIRDLAINERHLHVLHSFDWIDPARWSQSRILIVGGGMRAVELAEECVRDGIQPVVSARGARIETWPQRILGQDLRSVLFPLLRFVPIRVLHGFFKGVPRFRAIDRGFKRFVANGMVAIKPEIEKINRNCVTFDDGSSAHVDVIVCATGFEFLTPFLPSRVSRTSLGCPLLNRGRCAELASVLFIGFPDAFRSDSQFIHGIAKDAQVVARSVAKKLTTHSPDRN